MNRNFLLNIQKVLALSVLFISPFTLYSQQLENINQSEKFAQNLLLKLSVTEKVNLLSGMGISRSEFGDQDAPYFGVKGIPEKGIPDFIMGHGITGVRTGRDTNVHSTYFCTPIAIGSSWNVPLYEEVGVAIAKEMRALGQDLNLGPTINIIRNPFGGRNWECLSEDPYLTSKFIVPYVKAMQNNGIVCGPKHFVANNQEHNRFDINNILDERTLREIYLPAFKAAVIEGGAMNIMSSYNRLNGVFMSQNKYLLKDILRDEWGFKGFVLSDFSNGLRSTLAGVYGGLNLEMPGPLHYGDKLLKAIDNGEIAERDLDSMLFDIIKTMHWIGAFDRDRFDSSVKVHTKENVQLARTVTQESLVLLKNDKNRLLEQMPELQYYIKFLVLLKVCSDGYRKPDKILISETS